MDLNRRIIVVCMVTLALIATLLMLYLSPDEFGNPAFRRRKTQWSANKAFLYVVQLEECLDRDYMGTDVFGRGLSQDVLVLSYKTLCSDHHPPHIRYIKAEYKTTWTTGRNYLYQYIKNNQTYQKYNYYIFMDGDVRLVNNKVLKQFGVTLNKEGINITNSKQSPWRKFESFLLDYRPAIAEVDHIGHFRAIIPKIPKDKRKGIPPYLSSFLFDAMFNAFHRDVLDILLPYDDDLELISWWASQQYMQCKVFFRYHAQMIIFLPVLGVNNGHSKYPTKLYEPKNICKREFNLAPKHIRISNISARLLEKSSITDVPAFTYMAPAKTDMEQYKYFGNTFLNYN